MNKDPTPKLCQELRQELCQASMNKSQRIHVYIVHLIKNGEKYPTEIRTKIRGVNFVRYLSDLKGPVSSKEFYNIPEGFKCILIQ